MKKIINKNTKKYKIVLYSIALIIPILILYHFNYNDYEHNVKALTELNIETLNEMVENNDSFTLYLGKKTCPYCVEFLPLLNDVIHKNNLKVFI